MTSLLVSDARIATPAGVIDHGWLAAVDGQIAAFGDGPVDQHALRASLDAARAATWDPDVIDAKGAWLLPGFVDVHVHGAMGHDVMDGDAAGLDAMARFYAEHGVTGFLATTWTASEEVTMHALRGVAEAIHESSAEEPTGGARLLGAHLEGPYLTHARCGAQDTRWIRPGDVDEISRLLDTGVVRVVTLAPEVMGNRAVIDACRRRGVVVSAGHTDATYQQLLDAVELGVRHVTHLFNAMPPLHHREPGPIGAALETKALTVELIADGVHVHPTVLRAAYASCGPDRVVLVTDAMRAAGMPPGEFTLGDRSVQVGTDAVRLPDGVLAGSVLTLDVALRNLSVATGRSLGELWPTASLNAARVAGVAQRTGSIEIGKDADLTLVDDQIGVHLTAVAGHVVHRAALTPSDPSARSPG